MIFKSLTKKSLLEDRRPGARVKLQNRLLDKNITDQDRRQGQDDMLADKGYDTTFGARPLKRIIQNLILDELSLEIIEGKIKEGDKVTIDLGIKDQITINKS